MDEINNNKEQDIKTRFKKILEEMEEKRKDEDINIDDIEKIKIEFPESSKRDQIKTRGLIASTIKDAGIESIIIGNMCSAEIILALLCIIESVIDVIDKDDQVSIPNEIVYFLVVDKINYIMENKEK